MILENESDNGENGLTTLVVDNHVAFVVLANPPLNVITKQVRDELHAILDQLEGDRNIRAVVISGAPGSAFCAGADLAEEETLNRETVRVFLDEDNGIYDRFEALQCPVIAAIEGYCMGGGLELALACDFRVVGASALLRAAGVRVGLVVSTTRLTQKVSASVASDVILTGRTFDGCEAVRLGVATRLAASGSALTRATELAEEIARRAPLAVAMAKIAIREASELPFNEAYDKEMDHFAALIETRDHKAAIRAFFERSVPTFEGR